MVEEFAGPRDICQAVLTAIFTSGVLQQLFECPPQSLPDIRTKQRRKFKASGFRKQYHEGSTTSSHVMTPLVKCCGSTCSSKQYLYFSWNAFFCLSEIRPIPWFLTEGEIEVLVDPSTWTNLNTVERWRNDGGLFVKLLQSYVRVLRFVHHLVCKGHLRISNAPPYSTVSLDWM